MFHGLLAEMGSSCLRLDPQTWSMVSVWCPCKALTTRTLNKRHTRCPWFFLTRCVPRVQKACLGMSQVPELNASFWVVPLPSEAWNVFGGSPIQRHHPPKWVPFYVTGQGSRIKECSRQDHSSQEEAVSNSGAQRVSR